MPDGIRQLGSLETLEVSLVPKGANKKRFALRKQEKDMTFDAVITAVLENELDNEANIDKILKSTGMSDKAMAAAKSMLKIATGFKDEMPGDLMKTLAKLAGYGEDEMDKVAKSAKPNLEGLAPEAKAEIEALWKANKEAKERADKAEALLKAERDERLTKEFITKTAEDFQHLPEVKAEEFGPVLKSLSEADPEGYGKLVEVLKAAEEALKQSVLLKAAGRPSTHETMAGGAWEQIEKLAEGVVQKAESALTKAQAIDQVLKTPQGRALYQDYLKEHPRQAG